MIKTSNLITHDDALKPNGLIFQGNAAFQLKDLQQLPDYMIYFLALMLFVVSYIMLVLTLNYREAKKSEYIERVTLIELILITTPVLTLVLIVFTYFKLLYLIDKTIDISLVIYLKGYQFPDFTNNEKLVVQLHEFLDTRRLELIEFLSEIDWNKFYMDNTGSSSGRGIFTNIMAQLANPSVSPPANPLPVFTPVTEHYSHGINSLTEVIIQELNREGQAANFFFIDDITRKSCTITFIKPIPDIYAVDADSIEQIRLLKRLVSCFPNGYHYNYTTKSSMLDAYRLQGLVAKVVEESNNEPDWRYKSDQNRPDYMFPYYDSDRPPGYYQPWASDIADSLSKYRKDTNRSSDNRVTLDSYSAIFLATFRNANHLLSPTANACGGSIVLSLRNL